MSIFRNLFACYSCQNCNVCENKIIQLQRQMEYLLQLLKDINKIMQSNNLLPSSPPGLAACQTNNACHQTCDELKRPNTA